MTITDEMVERALNATTEELPEGVQYALIRGLKAMGWEIAITGSHDVMRAALTAALEGRGEPDVTAAMTITHERAREAARRLIAGSFRRDGERLADDKRPRFSIPTRVEHDDDTVIVTYIEQQQQLATDIARIRADAVAGEQNGGDIK